MVNHLNERSLISGYMKSVRPVKKVKDIVNVTLDLMLLRIVGLVSKENGTIAHLMTIYDTYFFI